MNHDSYENLLKEPTEHTRQTATEAAPKRTYAKREKKIPTIASLNEQIAAKELEIGAKQAELEGLTAQRNELYFAESEGMGLINLLADPEKAKWLADLVKQTTEKKNY